jgi:acetoin utilization protein AcuC
LEIRVLFCATVAGGNMSKLVTYVYNDDFQEYNFGSDHPLQPVRLKLAYELSNEYGIFDNENVRVVAGHLASKEELLLVHDQDYIDAVMNASKSREDDMSFLEYGVGPGDNPAFEHMHEAAAMIAGASITAVDAVMESGSDHAISISGGLHHALRNKASGFCIYNDCSIAIEHACKKYGIRVVYLDTDAHHGDGVQWSFYDRPDVLTISLHEDGRFLFPGTGFIDEVGTGAGEGFSVNLPFEPGVYDKLYMDAFEQIVPPIIRAFKPDLIVSQNGCDTHYTDPLAGMSLSTGSYESIYSTIHNLAHEVCDGRMVALGGGGYQIYQVVPRAWTLLTADLVGMSLDDYTPSSWQDFCSEKATFSCPLMLRDKEMLTLNHRFSVEDKVAEMVAKVKTKVFPYFDLA